MFVTKPISALLLAATATALALPEPQTITVNEAGIAAFKRQLSESCNKIQSTYNNIDSGIAGLESDFGEPLGTFTLPHHSFQPALQSAISNFQGSFSSALTACDNLANEPSSSLSSFESTDNQIGNEFS